MLDPQDPNSYTRRGGRLLEILIGIAIWIFLIYVFNESKPIWEGMV